MGLLAVIGPSRKLQWGFPAFWARSRAKVRRSVHSRSRACSWATKSGLGVTGWNIWPRCATARSWAGRGGAPVYRAGRRGGPDGAGYRPVAAGYRRVASRDPPRAVSFPPMSTPQRTPRVRSAFAAAFLSLLFPGLGHAYA